MPLNTELMKYGLSQKEADVYLTMLEMGFATVQQIAQKSGVNRATTYIVLKRLMELGIASTFEKGKKTFFAAENPKGLTNVLSIQEKELQDKRKELDQLMPNLLGVFNATKNKPTVKYYEGSDQSLEGMRQDFYRTDDRVVSVFYPYEFFHGLTEEQKETGIKDHEKRMKQGYKFHFLVSVPDALEAQYKEKDKKYFDRLSSCYLKSSQLPIDCEIDILGDKMVVFKKMKEPKATDMFGFGIMIVDKQIVQNYSAIFQLVWSLCKK